MKEEESSEKGLEVCKHHFSISSLPSFFIYNMPRDSVLFVYFQDFWLHSNLYMPF